MHAEFNNQSPWQNLRLGHVPAQNDQPDAAAYPDVNPYPEGHYRHPAQSPRADARYLPLAAPQAAAMARVAAPAQRASRCSLSRLLCLPCRAACDAVSLAKRMAIWGAVGGLIRASIMSGIPEALITGVGLRSAVTTAALITLFPILAAATTLPGMAGGAASAILSAMTPRGDTPLQTVTRLATRTLNTLAVTWLILTVPVAPAAAVAITVTLAREAFKS